MPSILDGRISSMRVARIADDMIMVSHTGCVCVFTFGMDDRGLAVVKGNRNCERWPGCKYPIHTALEMAQDEFDRAAVTPSYTLTVGLP